MGADTKQLRTRIKSVTSTLHLTEAMGLVASSKIRRATDKMYKSREFAEGLSALTRVLTSCPECKRSPYMRQGGDRTVLLVIAGDRGLAGGYNSNVFKLAAQYPDARLIPIGKRACDRFGAETVSSEYFTSEQAYELASLLCEQFRNEEFDRLGIICTRYDSVLTQTAVLKWLFPLSSEQQSSEPQSSEREASVIFEPDEVTVLNMAVLHYISGEITAAIRESFACEVAARRNAMDSASRNAQTMIDDLQLQFNRARQGAITQEITEIVAGSGN